MIMEELLEIDAEVKERRSRHFSRLDRTGEVYLDQIGSALPSEVLLANAFSELSGVIIANPHSAGSSQAAFNTSQKVNQVRRLLLERLNGLNEFDVVFTSGATAALKLVGEAFPFGPGSEFVTLNENHTSVLGIRKYCLDRGGSWIALTEQALLQWAPSKLGPSLAAIPSQCNWSGYRPNLQSLIKSLVPMNGSSPVHILVDAAASPELDLSHYPGVSFLTLSFYKWFGYPTGLGCLLVRKSALNVLQKRYFGGGTIESALGNEDWQQLRRGFEAWEDGSLNFQGILGLRQALLLGDELRSKTRSVFLLAKYLVSKLRGLKHENGSDVCRVYSWPDNANESSQGVTVTFNCKESNGSWIGYSSLAAVAQLAKIHIRTGCFCNPGACSKYLGLSNSEVKSQHASGHVCWDDNDIIAGLPTGAVRVSLGPHTTIADLDRLINLVQCIAASPGRHSTAVLSTTKALSIESLIIYPIKSCGGFTVSGSWMISETGFLLDREWALVDSSGSYLALKRYPQLIRIRTEPNLHHATLRLSHPDHDSIEVPFTTDSTNGTSSEEDSEELFVCGRTVKGRLYSNMEVESWLHSTVHLRGIHLVRAQKKSNLETSTGNDLLLANEAQFLVIGSASIDDLNKRLPADCNPVSANVFRPNIVIKTENPYEEDSWLKLSIGGQMFRSLGPCSRCKTICINERDMTVSAEPLRTLTSYRRASGGKVLFGALFQHVPHESKAPYTVSQFDDVVIEARRV